MYTHRKKPNLFQVFSQLSGSFGYDPGVLSLSIRRLQTFPRPNLAVIISRWIVKFYFLHCCLIKYIALLLIQVLRMQSLHFTEKILRQRWYSQEYTLASSTMICDILSWNLNKFVPWLHQKKLCIFFFKNDCHQRKWSDSL